MFRVSMRIRKMYKSLSDEPVITGFDVSYNGFKNDRILDMAKGYKTSEAERRVAEELYKVERKEVKSKDVKVSGGSSSYSANGKRAKMRAYFKKDEEDEEKGYFSKIYKAWKKLVMDLFRVG